MSPEAAPHLERASAEPEPASLAAATRLRASLPAERAAAVLHQVALRRRAAARLDTDDLFLTADGLEQATRPDVSRWRARRLAEAGAVAVWDLGSGLGLDAIAMAAAGLRVTLVERDPVTAVLARANLALAGMGGEVRTAAVEDVLGEIPHDAAVFCDPARRTARGRTWDVADLSPSWDLVSGLLDGTRLACVKLGPGVPYRILPESAETTWVSHDGDLVEASVWAGAGGQGERAALLLPGDNRLVAGANVGSGPLGRFLYEPDPAVIRAGAVGALAGQLGAHRVASEVAYLTSDHATTTPYATSFEVLEVLPTVKEAALRVWVTEHGVGTLEIKKRGVEVDPATLRRRLRPKGPASATLVLTPTLSGAASLVVRRVTP